MVVVAGLLSSSLALAPSVHAALASSPPTATPVTSGPLTAMDAASASALADSSGQPVEVLPDRTDWSQTFAEPGDGFTTAESLEPQRVQEADGSWVPVDTTLSLGPDGVVAPGPITTGLTLSDGGSGPLFTLSQDDESLAVSWPFGSLPVPSLSAATATYANVLPGVNLLVTATPDGVSDIIEVMSAAAAANPDLMSLNLPISTNGVSVSADSTGSLTAVDSSGNTVFSAPPAQMWDSAAPVPTGVAAQATPEAADTGLPDAADGPMPGDHQAVMSVSASATGLDLTPVSSVLSGQSVVYPVFIDPTWTSDQSSGNGPTWSDVWQSGSGGTGGTWEYTDPAGGIRAGVYCSPNNNGNCLDSTPDSTYGIYRSYLNFPLPPGYRNSQPDYTDAQLQLQETWSWSCSPSELDLWQTDPATEGMTWANRPQQLTALGSATTANGWEPKTGQSTCPASQVNLPAGAAMAAAGAADYSANTVTFELRADDDDEANWHVNSWKRFDASSVELLFYWEHAPVTPTDYGTEDVFNAATGQYDTNCGSRSSPDYVDNNHPTWQAWIDDPLDREYDAHNNLSPPRLNGEFRWDDVTTQTSSDPNDPVTATDNPQPLTAGTDGGPVGGRFYASRTGTPGDEYGWQAYGQTLDQVKTGIGNDTAAVLAGDKSDECYFVIDTTVPSGTVNVSGPLHPAIGTTDQYTFTDTTDSNVVGYDYGIGSAGETTSRRIRRVRRSSP